MIEFGGTMIESRVGGTMIEVGGVMIDFMGVSRLWAQESCRNWSFRIPKELGRIFRHGKSNRNFLIFLNLSPPHLRHCLNKLNFTIGA
jgi:hypothetical protein